VCLTLIDDPPYGFSPSSDNEFITSMRFTVNFLLLPSSQSIFPSVFDLTAIILDYFLGNIPSKYFFFEAV
jgi:hypothetical protein